MQKKCIKFFNVLFNNEDFGLRISDFGSRISELGFSGPESATLKLAQP